MGDTGLESPEEAHQRLIGVRRDDPKRAIGLARELPAGDAWDQVRAACLVEAGYDAKDAGAVAEGKGIYEQMRTRHGCLISYNLANAIVRQVDLDPFVAPDWYLRTAEQRRTARALFGEAAKDSMGEVSPTTATQALTNLGNELDRSHRWVEALEAYQRALDLYPNNGAASGAAAELLLRIVQTRTSTHALHLRALVMHYAHHAQANAATVADFVGPEAVERFSLLPSDPTPLPQGRPWKSEYEKFVARNRLFLSHVLHGTAHDAERWDDAQLERLSDANITKGRGPPPIVAMFNVLKAEYLVLRRLVFDAVEGPPTETGAYFDTLDYAVYGRRFATLSIAQRAALDLLDKVAVALNEYLQIGEKPAAVHFATFWRAKPNSPEWRAALRSEIAQGNHALVALSEIEADLSDGSSNNTGPGLLTAHKRARKAGTHRFIVLHDGPRVERRESSAIERHELDDFERISLDTMKLARAALLHLLEVVELREKRLEGERRHVGVLALVPHHKVLGAEPRPPRGRRVKRSGR